MNAPQPTAGNRDTASGSGRMRRRPREAAKVVLLPPVAVPVDAQRRRRAVAALTALFTQRWDQHGHRLDPADGADGSSSDDD